MNELMIIVEIAGRRCALNAHDVSSVIELGEVTPVPRTPDYIAGITAMRSQSMTVIDCRLALGIDPSPFPTDDRGAVVKVAGYPYALIVDRIDDITTSHAEPGSVSGGFGPEWSRVATGMTETPTGPALLIDLAQLIIGPGKLGQAA
ncbi:MAG: chemotaxis protein CheW [Pseudomonadota bacterium]